MAHDYDRERDRAQERDGVNDVSSGSSLGRQQANLRPRPFTVANNSIGSRAFSAVPANGDPCERGYECHSNGAGSPAPIRTTSAVPSSDKSTTVVGSGTTSPDSMTTST